MSRSSSLLLLCIITLMASLTTRPALGQTKSKWSSGIDFSAKAANREKSRWSLTDWLAMKERNRMMDMWLTVNAPNPYEFVLGGSYISGESKITQGTGLGTADKKSIFYAGEFAAYAQLVGVSAEYENNTDEDFSSLGGLFNLRLLGNSVQNTSVTLSYGLRTKELSGTTTTRLSQQFGQAALQLYLTKFFGIDGKYRYYLKSDNDQLGDVNGDLTEAGVFIDFEALRLFGTWYKESNKTKTPAALEDTITERTGIKAGLKIFF